MRKCPRVIEHMSATPHYRYGSPAAHDLAAIGNARWKSRALGDRGAHGVPRDLALIHKAQATVSLRIRRLFRSTARGQELVQARVRVLAPEPVPVRPEQALRRALEQPPCRGLMRTLNRHRPPVRERPQREP